MKRIVAFLVAALLTAATQAQTVFVQSGTQPALEVQRLAPQLVAFAGSDVNFQNLVNGLALGVPVTLTTMMAPGQTQVVTFTPTGTMTPVQIAQLLENARQSLIARGIATPSAQQLAPVIARQFEIHQLAPNEAVGRTPRIRPEAEQQEFRRQRAAPRRQKRVDPGGIRVEPAPHRRRQCR